MSPLESKMEAITEVPTLYPTEEEFSDPITYLSSPTALKLGVKYGMVKVKPPSSFKPPLSINKSRFRFVPRIQKLKELNILNRCRMFFYKQLLHYNQMNGLELPKETFEVVDIDTKLHYYDLFISIVKYLKNGVIGKELPDISSGVLLPNKKLWDDVSKELSVSSSSLSKIYLAKLQEYFNFLSAKSEFTNTLIPEKYPKSLLNDDSSDSESETEDDDEDEDDNCLICKKSDHHEQTLLCDSCDKPYHIYCLSPPLTKIPKFNWYCDNCVIGNGHYGFKDSTIEYFLDDFKELSDEFDKHYFKDSTKPDLNEREKIFWELVNSTDNDVKINYGADIHNLRKGEVSGFPTREYTSREVPIKKEELKWYINHPMNLNNLPFARNSLLNYLTVDISGMTIPWIYVGNTFSTFCWHVEDQYTLSANYQHFGATKKWYSIPSSYADDFEKFMKSLAPDLFAKQPDILHQLVTLVSPFKLVENGIQCYTANQEPGEYVITYPRVYHSGFNSGFNFNEAVNFTMVDWLDFGLQATQNYKKGSNKASVFDIWELVINILKRFETKEDIEDGDLKLIRKSLEILKPRVNDEYALRETLEELIDKKPTQMYFEKRDGINYDVSREAKEQEEDGISCSKCKGFCTFSFVKHFEPLVTPGSKNYLPITPQSSPDTPTDHKSSSKKNSSSISRHSKRLKIRQAHESHRVEILCLDDYLKVEPNDKDELITLRDLEETKKLIQKVDSNIRDFLFL